MLENDVITLGEKTRQRVLLEWFIMEMEALRLTTTWEFPVKVKKTQIILKMMNKKTILTDIGIKK